MASTSAIGWPSVMDECQHTRLSLNVLIREPRSVRSPAVATGRRDMGLAFAGWQRPSVMAASAA
jgi:hypothetical protein